eukprot:g9187.t1
MVSLQGAYPFDEKCKLSKDADVTLIFDDESYLKAPKCLLEMASPVLKTAIRDCRHNRILHLPETSKNIWIMILNHLHPSGVNSGCLD